MSSHENKFERGEHDDDDEASRCLSLLYFSSTTAGIFSPSYSSITRCQVVRQLRSLTNHRKSKSRNPFGSGMSGSCNRLQICSAAPSPRPFMLPDGNELVINHIKPNGVVPRLHGHEEGRREYARDNVWLLDSKREVSEDDGRRAQNFPLVIAKHVNVHVPSGSCPLRVPTPCKFVARCFLSA